MHKENHENDKQHCTSQIQSLLCTERDLRHDAQEEELARDLPYRTEEIMTWFEKVNKSLWYHKRKWWKYRSELGQGAVARAFDLWRSNPAWYMHEVLVEDCAQKQGCCARGCGCCEKRQKTSTRLAAGHCALTCPCCRRLRGFELTPEEQKNIYNDFDLQGDKTFYDRIELASIWGLSLNSDKAPDDLIKLGCELGDAENPDDELCGIDRTDDEDGFSSKTVSSWIVAKCEQGVYGEEMDGRGLKNNNPGA
ncbi:unnamed protein product [Penicillium salamii]|uniref:Uncharacterized protein n=1 Tax=Penicillium salamii TaxID=1612424 RepID=A0A9W4IQM9_9EURO|nr:unnamed protein product [Penicillium salamii]